MSPFAESRQAGERRLDGDGDGDGDGDRGLGVGWKGDRDWAGGFEGIRTGFGVVRCRCRFWRSEVGKG
jgi:hypothetical protein